MERWREGICVFHEKYSVPYDDLDSFNSKRYASDTEIVQLTYDRFRN